MPSDLLWAADFGASIQDSAQADFAQIDSQRYDDVSPVDPDRYGPISHPGPLPLVDGPFGFGRCLELELDDLGRRLELLPPAVHRVAHEGDQRWFRFDVLLDSTFRLTGAPGWGIIVSQVHQGSIDYSPPVELQVKGGHLVFSGGNAPENPPRCEGIPLFPLSHGVAYEIVLGVSFRAAPGTSTVEVWVDGDQKFRCRIPWRTIVPAGTASYWKGASFYTGPGNGGRMFQRNHRIGRTRAAVS